MANTNLRALLAEPVNAAFFVVKPMATLAIAAGMENSGIPLIDDESVARSRLATLLGEAEADRMIERFYQALRDAIMAIDGGEAPGGYGHRIGGLAGTMGFAMLSAAWLTLQDGREAWPTVRASTLAAIARHERHSVS